MRNTNEILNDSSKATLFGKFYERIVLGWLKEKEGFTPFDGKPRIYWKDVELAKEDNEPASRLNQVLTKYKHEKQFCIPDGLLQKEGKLYVWEAKNWPLWSEGKKPLDQLRDVLLSMPFILAREAVYRTKKHGIHGILFSWWSKPDDVETLEEEIGNLIKPSTFEMFYTAEVLEECIRNKYSWYFRIINEEKARIDKLFGDLLGES